MSKRRNGSRALRPGGSAGTGRACHWPGCTGDGAFRAPRSRTELDAFQWFCLDHIRLYNAAWNYYEGMSDHEVEADIRMDSVWRRPSWPIAGRHGAVGPIDDPLGLFGAPPPPTPPPTPESQALQVLELRPPLTQSAVKARYKELVKRHHPDANGGDKRSEERFKEIHQAYRTIMDRLSP